MMIILSFKDGLIVFADIICFLEIWVYITYNDLFKIRSLESVLDQCTVPAPIKDVACIQNVQTKKRKFPCLLDIAIK